MKTQNIQGALFGSGPCYFKQPGLGGTKPAVVSHTSKSPRTPSKQRVSPCVPFYGPIPELCKTRLHHFTGRGKGKTKKTHEAQVPAACICLHWPDKEAWACLLARSCRYSAAFFTCCIRNGRQRSWNKACARKASLSLFPFLRRLLCFPWNKASPAHSSGE